MVHHMGLKCFEAQTFTHSCVSNLLFTHNYSSPSVSEGLLEIIAGGLNDGRCDQSGTLQLQARAPT